MIRYVGSSSPPSMTAGRNGEISLSRMSSAAIDSIVGDDVRLKLINPLRPAILEDAAGDFTYLIMPIRLAG